MSEAAGITVVHVSPHPDDEAIGAGATLLSLREAGSRVINLACSLGRVDEHERRRREVETACELAEFELHIHDPPLAISAGDDLGEAQRSLAETLLRLIRSRNVSLLVSPSPHDGHYGHEVVGRAVRDALRASPTPKPRWWMWGLWGDLPFPTLMFPFGEERLAKLGTVLAAHEGEIARNDYPVLVSARATVNRVLGPEKVFGYGGPGIHVPYVELLTEAIAVGERWHAAASRLLDPSVPLEAAEANGTLDWWLDTPSANELMRELDNVEAQG